jgi:hypothetical protein
MNPTSPAFAEPRGTPRTDPFAAQEYRGGHVEAPHGYGPTNYSGHPPAQLMHNPNQPGYPYPGVAYQSDSEAASQQLLSHGQQSNFGILGDPIDSKNKRRRGNLPKPVTDILRAWFHEHLDHPYPSEEDKQVFMTRTGLSISQVG